MASLVVPSDEKKPTDSRIAFEDVAAYRQLLQHRRFPSNAEES